MKPTPANRFPIHPILRLVLVSPIALLSACERSGSNKPADPPAAFAQVKPRPVAKPSSDIHPIRAGFATACRIKNKQDRSNAILRAVNELRKLDTSVIVKLFSHLDLADSKEDYDLGMCCINALASKDARAALELIEKLPRLELLATGTASDLSARLLKQDKEACLEWLGRHPLRKTDPLCAIVFGLIADLAESDPHAAVAMLEGKPHGNRQLASMVLSKIAATDVGLAAELGRERLGEEAFGEIAGALLSSSARTDYFGCMKLYETLGPAARISAAGSLIHAMWGKDPAQTMRFLESQPSGVVASALKHFRSDNLSATSGPGVIPSLAAFVANDPERATTVLSKVPFTEANRSLYRSFGNGLASLDPDAAAIWLATIPEGPAKDDLTREMFQTLGNKQPQSAWERAAGQPEEARQQAFLGVAAALATSDTDKALAMAKSIPDSLQPDVFREIGRANALGNPISAVALLEDPDFGNRVGVSFRNEMLQQTVGKWSETDLPAARKWLESVHPEDRTPATRGLISTWIKTDPDAAVAWLAAQPQGSARDAGAAVAIKQVEQTNPAKAREWSGMLGR